MGLLTGAARHRSSPRPQRLRRSHPVHSSEHAHIACAHGQLEDTPRLGHPSRRPIITFDPVLYWGFFKPEKSGLLLAQEWLGGLKVLHHLSTESTLDILRHPCRKHRRQREGIRKDSFRWWPGPKPTNPKVFLDKLNSSKADSLAVCLFNKFVPQQTGFYLACFSDGRLHLHDDSETIYDIRTRGRHCSGVFRCESRWSEISVLFPFRIALQKRNCTLEIQTESSWFPAYFIPAGLEVSKTAGVVRCSLTEHLRERSVRTVPNAGVSLGNEYGIAEQAESNQRRLI